jgi:Fuc2NAc and GlcNAc transferase
LPAVFLITLVGFLDDRYQLRARLRFLAQLIATVYVLAIIGSFGSLDLGSAVINLGLFGYIFTTLALLWSTNLYNFMDGIDALAAVEALFIFGFGGYFIWCAGGIGFAYAIWAVAFIVIGFLVWNRPPAKVFMGDAGSTTIGFLVTMFAIIGEKTYHVPALLWVILYGVFWFDATVTLIRRVAHGDKFYQPHKQFAFHRLQLHDWSHGKFVFGVVCVNVYLASLAMLAFYFSRYMLWYLLAAVFVLALIYYLIERIQPMYSKNE